MKGCALDFTQSTCNVMTAGAMTGGNARRRVNRTDLYLLLPCGPPYPSAATSALRYLLRWSLSTKERILRFIRRLVCVCGVVMLAAAVSGCIVRPLRWDGHERHDRERYGAHSEHQQRDDGRREDWQQRR